MFEFDYTIHFENNDLDDFSNYVQSNSLYKVFFICLAVVGHINSCINLQSQNQTMQSWRECKIDEAYLPLKMWNISVKSWL